MRLLLVARRYWPAVGGVESFLRHLARGLGEAHEVTVLAHRVDGGPGGRLTDSLLPPPRFDLFDDGPVRVLPLSIGARRRAMMAPLLAQVTPGLRRHAYGPMRLPMAALYARTVGPLIAQAARGADVIHMFGGDLLAAAAVRAGRYLGVPVAVTPFAHRGQWGDDPASAAAYRAADRVVALLDADAVLYRDLGVQADRIAIAGVCSPGARAGGGQALRDRYGIGGPLVLFLGVRRPYKGFDLLLQAAPLVGAERGDVTFAFVGPGPRLPEEVRASVLDVGEVADQEREAWLDAADLLCLPSEGEIFPVSILEAWSVGTPVLTSDLPTLTELVSGNGGGMTVPRTAPDLAAGILRLLADPERHRAMGEAGRRAWLERYTVDVVAAAHERLYAVLTGRRRAGCAA